MPGQVSRGVYLGEFVAGGETYSSAGPRLLVYAAGRPKSVHFLPTELLMYIFHLVNVEGLNDIITLMLVCRTWHKVVIKTSELWSDLLGRQNLNSFSKRALKTLLQRSASRRLSLRIDTTLVPLAGDRELALHTRRITSLTVSLDYSEHMMLVGMFKHQCFPALESLTLTSELLYELPIGNIHLERLADSDLPRLRRLRIPGVLTPVMVVATLTSLELEPAANQYLSLVKIPVAELLAALKRCPSLQSLDVDLNPNITPSSRSWLFSTGAANRNYTTVHLPQLRQLHISEIHRQALHSGVIPTLVAHMVFPPTAFVTLRGMGHVFDFVLPPSIEQLLPVFYAPMDHIAFSQRHHHHQSGSESESVVQASYNGAQIFHVSVTDRFSNPRNHVAFQVNEIKYICRFSAHTIRTFDFAAICYDRSHPNSYNLNQLLDMFPYLSRLILREWPFPGPETGISQKMDILSDALSRADTCPLLGELDLFCVGDAATALGLENAASRIVEVLRGRKSRLRLLVLHVPQRPGVDIKSDVAREGVIAKLSSVADDVHVRLYYSRCDS